ncbi:Golgin candidate [Thalictrum thalictroides]|uniref:Golgin candidate n=1 Tax=Thalictrum thalictroides TaxID=46969 RepID=A0A7J6WP61_THATH|nr:Golgin candidate [Thalictrum thalictroides]
MANWISSKLKVAETFLQQIDQQAADSLGKGEKPESSELNPHHQKVPTKIESVVTPLKDQFKKKNIAPKSNDFYKKDSQSIDRSREIGTGISPNPILLTPGNSSKPIPKLTDSDWTQLLSTPDQSTSPGRSHTNGVSKINGSRKDAKKLLELKKNQRIQGSINSKSTRKSNIVLDSRVNGETADIKRSSEGKGSGSGESGKIKDNVESINGNVDVGEKEELGIGKRDLTPNLELTPVSSNVDGISETKKQVDGEQNGIKVDKSEAAIRTAIPPLDSLGDSALSSDGTSASDTDSSSTSDSEKERERKAERARKRERILAEKAAAKAIEVIKEQENIVARLEGEKQSLDKMLEERAKQQAQEASELQMSMMETMDAVDLEKQKHNNTRMEAFARLTKLETANADLAKSLATTQWNLEIESNQVAELRKQIELKEAIQEDLKRRTIKIHQSGSSPNQLEVSKGLEFEREILEAEYSFTCDKIGQLQEKGKKLEENIDILKKEIEVPTDVEVELKRRLAQLTNHLIQKQSQVESLSSEKATLLFRIETVSRLLEEEKSTPQLSDLAGPSLSEDLEAGTWDVSKVKLRPLFAENIQTGSQHLGSLLGQLDIIFSAGAAFIRRNSSAKYMALFYLVCLHLWVLYIFMSHTQASDTRSGAVVSLESINKTTGP